jgi:anti-anti-sigma regulatory factor
MAAATRRATTPWLTMDEYEDDVVLVRVVGGVAAQRGVDLWSDLEGALERAAGRMVVVDLSRATGFDLYTLDSLARVARASARRHLDFCAVMRPSSPLAQYAHLSGLDRMLPIFESVSAALGDRSGFSRGQVLLFGAAEHN